MPAALSTAAGDPSPLGTRTGCQNRTKRNHPALKIIPPVAVLVYLVLGFAFGWWSTAWLVFLVYPIALAIVGATGRVGQQ